MGMLACASVTLILAGDDSFLGPSAREAGYMKDTMSASGCLLAVSNMAFDPVSRIV